MKKFYKILGFALIVSFVVSCSPKVVGTWNVQNYETTSPGQLGVALRNIGTMTFKSNGSGDKQLEYSVFGSQKSDVLPFMWQMEKPYVVIDSEGSDLSKIWIVTKCSRKYIQMKSTNGAKEVQILELSKEPKK